jgi:hypothetical protein
VCGACGAHVRLRSVSTYNLITETPGGDPRATIVVGTHLDSVDAGPGVNDNGSGSATNLQMALLWKLLNLPTINKIRFAWWGAEELGLLGSRVRTLWGGGEAEAALCDGGARTTRSCAGVRGCGCGRRTSRSEARRSSLTLPAT